MLERRKNFYKFKWLLISIIFTILEDCETLILKANNYKSIKTIIDYYGLIQLDTIYFMKKVSLNIKKLFYDEKDNTY